MSGDLQVSEGAADNRWRRAGRRRAAALVVGGALTVGGCGGDDAATTDPGASMPELNLTTMAAETEFGPVDAHRATTSYTARLSDDRAIGIAFLEDLGIEATGSEISVRLYEGGRSAYMVGEVDADGAASLSSGELSHFDARVDLTIGDDAATGVAIFPDDAVDFTAPIATGDAGVCWARGTDEEPDLSIDWVVLADGSQWGCICHPPFVSPCCMMLF